MSTESPLTAGPAVLRRLGVNIDHVATIRQARRERYPDPVAAAIQAEQAGADQITCHLRVDRRHIQDHDLPRLRAAVQTLLNVEMAPTDEMVAIAHRELARRPGDPRRHRVTLVAERAEEITTEGGLDVVTHGALVREVSAGMAAAGIAVSLFIDPDTAQVEAAQALADVGVDMIELNTAAYAEAHGDHAAQGRELVRLATASRVAVQGGLELAAGHGLTHHNLPRMVAEVPEVVEYNIGHSIISRAVFVGLDTAVRDLITIIRHPG
ncbi:MAG: pyridoxine 5'-phosphate synthase [Alphaproteobacteria bacterium]|nr:pyridoxine 5'-phosphate synthase [Alphaproteobacteria bacterium]